MMLRPMAGLVFAGMFGFGLPEAEARGWGAGQPAPSAPSQAEAPPVVDAQAPVSPATQPVPAPAPDYPPPQWPPPPAPYLAPPQPIALPLPATLNSSGRFHRGIGIELLGVGPVGVWTRFGSGGGIAVTTAVQLDLGPRLALRLPISADSTLRHGDAAYVGLAFSPGLVYRWRSVDDQRWVPFVGAGLRLAASGVRRDFLGEPLVTTTTTITGPLHLHDFDDHHDGIFGSHHDDPNVDTHGTIAPELWAGMEFHASRWVAMIMGATYAWMRFDSEHVHLLRGTLAFRATL
jgi:hypothetical protein